LQFGSVFLQEVKEIKAENSKIKNLTILLYYFVINITFKMVMK
jgi:hypothetical protein